MRRGTCSALLMAMLGWPIAVGAAPMQPTWHEIHGVALAAPPSAASRAGAPTATAQGASDKPGRVLVRAAVAIAARMAVGAARLVDPVVRLSLHARP